MDEAICRRLNDLRDMIKHKFKLTEEDFHVN